MSYRTNKNKISQMKNDSLTNEIVQKRQQTENTRIDDQKVLQNNIINSLSAKVSFEKTWTFTQQLEGSFDSETNTWEDA